MSKRRDRIIKKIDKLLNKIPIRNATVFDYLSIIEYLKRIDYYETSLETDDYYE